MNLNKVLIAEDKEENRRAAKEAIPHATVVSSCAEAIFSLESQMYDLVLTDLQMETPWAGLDVVNKALARGAIPYTFSVNGAGHKGESIALFPDYHGYFEGHKSDSKIWRLAYESIGREEGTAKFYHQALIRAREFGVSTTLPRSVIFVVYGRQRESAPWVDMEDAK
jgi:hypothetical protein